MHDIQAWTAAELPDLLKELHDRGYKVVHLVPKGQVETIASYDTAAEKALAAKAAAKAANPMVARSIVWPMASATGADVAAVSPAGTCRKRTSHYKRVTPRPTIADGRRPYQNTERQRPKVKKRLRRGASSIDRQPVKDAAAG